MNNKSLIIEILIAVAMVVLLILFVNPFGTYMPNTLLTMLVIGFVIIFAIFASFIWKEKARDEREGLHRMLASRAAFLVGSGVLVLGIVLQTLRHSLDFWLVLTLAAMIIAKIIGRVYGESKY